MAMPGLLEPRLKAWPPLHPHASMCSGGLQKGVVRGEHLGPAPRATVEGWWPEVCMLVLTPLHVLYSMLCYPCIL